MNMAALYASRARESSLSFLRSDIDLLGERDSDMDVKEATGASRETTTQFEVYPKVRIRILQLKSRVRNQSQKSTYFSTCSAAILLSSEGYQANK
jgi:hypothetical protein